MSEHAEAVQQASPALSETRLGDIAAFVAEGSAENADAADLLAEVRRLQGENARIAEERETYRRAWNRSDELLASAREETAQAVRAERDACARIAEAGWRGYGDTDAPEIVAAIRSRSLPGETADA